MKKLFYGIISAVLFLMIVSSPVLAETVKVVQKIPLSQGSSSLENKNTISWEACHTDISATYICPVDVSWSLSAGQWKKTTGEYNIIRSFPVADSSVIPDNADITSATLNLPVTGISAGTEELDYYNIVQQTQANNSTLSLSDYSKCGETNNPPTGATSVKGSSLISNGIATWNLNSTGLTWISKTGYTKLGIRCGWDIENIAPPAVNRSFNAQGGGSGYMEVTYNCDSTLAPPLGGNVISITSIATPEPTPEPEPEEPEVSAVTTCPSTGADIDTTCGEGLGTEPYQKLRLSTDANGKITACIYEGISGTFVESYTATDLVSSWKGGSISATPDNKHISIDIYNETIPTDEGIYPSKKEVLIDCDLKTFIVRDYK